jgi:hypothetical protein
MEWPRRAGYLDESYDWQDGRVVYVLALAEIEGDPSQVRAALRELPRKKGGILHFSKESQERRVQLAKSISALPVKLTAVVSQTERHLRRARGVCVRDLAWAVGERLTDLVFEARQEAENAHDASVLEGLRSHGPDLRYAFRGKTDEPLLWIPDLLAGAVRQLLVDGEPAVADALGRIRRIDAR